MSTGREGKENPLKLGEGWTSWWGTQPPWGGRSHEGSVLLSSSTESRFSHYLLLYDKSPWVKLIWALDIHLLMVLQQSRGEDSLIHATLAGDPTAAPVPCQHLQEWRWLS